MMKFRENGAVGALLDEYEKAIIELQFVIKDISKEELIQTADEVTKDPDCTSIQTVMTHVVRAGYGYVSEIRRSVGEDVEFIEGVLLTSVEDYSIALNEMFEFNVLLFEEHQELKLEEYKDQNKIKVRWGQSYDVEQLIEHAIVHILRHRRQIEKFKIIVRN